MHYVFSYQTLVNREYNIYKEILFNPFLFSYLGIKDPKEIKDIIDFTKNKKANILENVLLGEKITASDLLLIYKILSDSNFFETEEFNLYSLYVDDLLFSDKVSKITIIVNDLSEEIVNMEIANIKKRFNNDSKLNIIKSSTSLYSEILKTIDWDCVSFRDIEQAIDVITNNKISNKDIILEETSFNNLDPVHYIILQEKDGRIDYRSMI